MRYTTTVPTVSLDVWVELFESAEGFGHEVRWIANGPKGEQPWSGSRWTRGYETLASLLGGLTDQLQRETGWAKVDDVIDYPYESIVHHHITEATS